MLPITHYLYLALALFAVGLGGAVLRRSLIVALLGIELMLVAVALCASAYARMFLDPGGQVAALLIVLVGLVEVAVAVAIATRMLGVRGEGDGEGESRDAAAASIEDWPGAGGRS